MPASWAPNTTDGTKGFMPITTGLGVRYPDMPPDLNGQFANGANALLETSSFTNGLWIHNVMSNFTLEGTFVQGALVRDWYPHNLGVPVLTFAGQVPNAYEKNRLGVYVRQSHITAVRDSTSSGKEAIRLTMPGTAIGSTVVPLVGGGSARGSYGNGWQNPSSYPHKGGSKGPHGLIDVVGYVDSFEFGATRFMTSYEYTFDFTIVQVLSWLGLRDSQISIPLSNINQMFTNAVSATVKANTVTSGTKPGKTKATPSGPVLSKALTGAVNTFSNLLGDFF